MIGEILAGIFVAFLALYGCAQLVRRICLWVTRCPGCVWYCRVAIPRGRTELAPLFCCLESQAAWADSADGRRTLVLLPEGAEGMPELIALCRESPSVIPVTASQLHAMLLQLAAGECLSKMQ